METLTKFIALTALFIGVLALERTYKIRDLQLTFKEFTATLDQTLERIRMTAHVMVERIDRFIQRGHDSMASQRRDLGSLKKAGQGRIRV